MWKIYTTLNGDLKKIYDFDPKKKLWQAKSVLSKRENCSGELWSGRLKDLIEELFGENICRIYKF